MKQFIQDICQAETNGACVMQRANGIIIRDLAVWPQAYTDAIQLEYPSAFVSFYECDGSTSGFNVLVTYENEAPKLSMTFKSHFITPNPWMQTCNDTHGDQHTGGAECDMHNFVDGDKNV
eukprot:3934472-Rhodomonas_salina.1